MTNSWPGLSLPFAPPTLRWSLWALDGSPLAMFKKYRLA